MKISSQRLQKLFGASKQWTLTRSCACLRLSFLRQHTHTATLAGIKPLHGPACQFGYSGALAAAL
jgi:hypothetical protein